MVPILWPMIVSDGIRISFAYQSFKWRNLAAKNAGVSVVVVGLSISEGQARLFEFDESENPNMRLVENISPYLVSGGNVVVFKQQRPNDVKGEMTRGNMPYDAGHFLLTPDQLRQLNLSSAQQSRFVRKIVGSDDFINGTVRYVIWIEDQYLDEALEVADFARRIEAVRRFRRNSTDTGADALAKRAHQMKTITIGERSTIVVPAVSSERRAYLPVGLLGRGTTLTNLAFALYDPPIWNLALIASRIHLVWIATVCGKMKTDFRYSNTLGWNTFPLPQLTEKNKTDLTRCAEEILLAREAHFPATIADLYDPDNMPADLRATHERNDETLERIYVGRRFRNDTERLEKLFDLYTKMTADKASGSKTGPGKRGSETNA